MPNVYIIAPTATATRWPRQRAKDTSLGNPRNPIRSGRKPEHN